MSEVPGGIAYFLSRTTVEGLIFTRDAELAKGLAGNARLIQAIGEELERRRQVIKQKLEEYE